jgi:hypothetical protein
MFEVRGSSLNKDIRPDAKSNDFYDIKTAIEREEHGI